MTARELAERILDRIKEGSLNPNAIVVRPFCMCDEEVGYVEASFLDQADRRWEPADGDIDKLFKYGEVPPGVPSITTLKLG